MSFQEPPHARQRFGTVLAALALGVVVIALALQQMRAPFRQLALQDIAGTLGALFIIVLLVERMVEILIGITKVPGSVSRKQLVASFSETEQAERPDEYKSARQELAQYKAKTQRLALLLSLAFGIVICSAGVGILSELLQELPADAPPIQAPLLRATDIVLTAGLIAGGSDAFHHFLNSIVSYFRNANEQMPRRT